MKSQEEEVEQKPVEQTEEQQEVEVEVEEEEVEVEEEEEKKEEAEEFIEPSSPYPADDERTPERRSKVRTKVQTDAADELAPKEGVTQTEEMERLRHIAMRYREVRMGGQKLKTQTIIMTMYPLTQPTPPPSLLPRSSPPQDY